METERVSSAVASIARTVLVRLAPGEDLFCGLRTVCERHGLRSGRIATMIGSLRTASLVCVTPDPANPGRVVYLEPRTVEGPLELIAALLLGISENPLVILLMINIILLFAGMLLDAISIAYVFLPILAPVIVTFGWDPIWFGVMMTINMAIGQVTPPVAVNLFVGARISGLTMEQIARPAVGLIVAAIAALALLTAFPVLTTFLPRMMGLM